MMLKGRFTGEAPTRRGFPAAERNERLMSFGIRPPKMFGSSVSGSVVLLFLISRYFDSGANPDRWMEASACWGFADTEKSISILRPGVENNTLLHNRQTCVIVIRSLFVGRPNSHLFFSREEAGYQGKDVRQNRFIGRRIDSSERSFGRIFTSHEPLTAVTYRHSRESR